MRLNSPRVRVIDLTRFFCSASECLPVIGGVLVHKDDHHLTVVFARTIAPYFEKELERFAGEVPLGHVAAKPPALRRRDDEISRATRSLLAQE